MGRKLARLSITPTHVWA